METTTGLTCGADLVPGEVAVGTEDQTADVNYNRPAFFSPTISSINLFNFIEALRQL